MKVLAVIAGGLGNQIQMTAAIRTLRERLGWDMEILSGGAPVAGDAMREYFRCPAHRPSWRPMAGEFDGAVALAFGNMHQVQDKGWNGLPWLNDLTRQTVGYALSEVDVSMNACRELGVKERDLIWHGDLNCDETFSECFDVVLANNYYKAAVDNPNTHWTIKGYPGFKSLATLIREKYPRLSMCCIGADGREAIEGVTDRTGIPLGCSLALIKRARFIVTTDSMAFHAGPCFDTKTFALWTGTSQVKNACPKFHASAVIVGRDDLECRKDCQEKSHRWTACKNWQCQEIGIGHVLKHITEYMEGQAWE